MDWAIRYKPSEKIQWGIALGLLALNLFLKFLFYDRYCLALDEPFSVFYAQLSPGEIIEALKSDKNPPLFELVLHYWVSLGGVKAAWVRIIPGVLVCSSVIPLFWLGQRIGGWKLGTLAGLFFTFSSFSLFVAHDTRAYGLLLFLSLCSFLQFIRTHESPGKAGYWVFLFVLDILLLFTHYMAFFVVLSQLVMLLVYGPFRKKQNLIGFGIVGVLLFLGYIPQLMVLFLRINSGMAGHYIGSPSVTGLYDLVWVFSNQPVMAVAFLGLLLAGLIFHFLKKKQGDSLGNSGIVLFLIVFPGMILLVFALGFKVPFFAPRHLIFALPFFYLLSAWIIQNLIPRSVKLPFALLMVLGMAFTLDLSPDHGYRWKEIAGEVMAEKNEKTCVLIHPEWLDHTLCYHAFPDVFSHPRRFNQEMKRLGIYPVLNPVDVSALPADKYSRAILLQGEVDEPDPNCTIQGELRKLFPEKIWETEFKKLKLILFEKRP